MIVRIEEKVTTVQEVAIDSDGDGFFAVVLHDNHTITRTSRGTKEHVKVQVEAIAQRAGMALYSLYHVDLQPGTKLIPSATDPALILLPDAWGRPFNPFQD